MHPNSDRKRFLLNAKVEIAGRFLKLVAVTIHCGGTSTEPCNLSVGMHRKCTVQHQYPLIVATPELRFDTTNDPSPQPLLYHIQRVLQLLFSGTFLLCSGSWRRTTCCHSPTTHQLSPPLHLPNKGQKLEHSVRKPLAPPSGSFQEKCQTMSSSFVHHPTM